MRQRRTWRLPMAGARWFGRSPAKPGSQIAASQQPRATPADVIKTSAIGKPEAAGGSGRFGALFSGIQRTSMSRPGSGMAVGKARAGGRGAGGGQGQWRDSSR